MASEQIIYSTDRFEISKSVPCAESPGLLQLHGRIRGEREAIVARLRDLSWKVVQLTGQGSAVARLPSGELLLLLPDDEFSLSRITTFEAGIEQIGRIFE